MALLPTWLVFAALAATTDVEVVKFTSASCAPCQAMEPVLEQIAARGFAVCRIDVEQHRQLADQYAIRSVPTLLIVAQGQIVDRIEGAQPLEVLLPRLESIRSAATRTSAVAAGSPAAAVPQFASHTPGGHAGAGPMGDRPSLGGQAVSQLEQRALNASVRLRIEDDNGHSFGTGTIIDVHGQDALVLTCGHIFRESQGKGRITIDLFAPGAEGPVQGQLIRYDLDRDLALVGLRTAAKIEPVRVAPVGWQPSVGMPLLSVGCNHGQPPTVMHGRLKAVNKYLGPENLTMEGKPVEGRSGGGLFSPDGYLIGVCNAADPELNEGLYAAYASVHRHLDDARLAFVYQQQPAGATQLAAATAPSPALPQTQGATAPAAASPLPAATRTAPNADLARTSESRGSEADAWSPLAQAESAAGAGSLPPIDAGPIGGAAEVICIVRTRDNPTSPSQVVVLDRPSRDFLSRLNEERRAQVERLATQMRSDRVAEATPEATSGLPFPTTTAATANGSPSRTRPATARFTSDRRLPHTLR